MIYYSSSFCIVPSGTQIEDCEFGKSLDDLINFYQEKYLSNKLGKLGDITTRWCIFTSSEFGAEFFYCYTVLEFESPRNHNIFKLKHPNIYKELVNHSFVITFEDVMNHIEALKREP